MLTDTGKLEYVAGAQPRLVRSQRGGLAALLAIPVLLGCVLRLLAVLYFSHIHYDYPDENLYWELGHRLRASHGLSLSFDWFGGYVRANEPSGYFGALFPPVVAMLQIITGDSIVLSRIILGELSWIITALGMIGFARTVVSRGYVALFLYALALFPNGHFLGSFLMTENLLGPCLVVAFWLGARYAMRPRKRLLAAWSVVYGLVHLTKQNLMGFQPIHYLILSRGMPWRRRLAGGLLAITVTGLVLLPWAMRNRLVLGRWVLETKSGFNLLLMNNTSLNKGIMNEDFVAVPAMPSWEGLSEVQRDAACKQVFFAFLREHPAKFCSLCVSRFLIAFRPTPISLQLPRLISWPYGVANCCVYLLAIVGMVWSVHRRILLDATALVIYTAAVTALTNASFRHRSYADPFMLLLAVVGVMAVRKTMETRRVRPAVVPVGAVG